MVENERRTGEERREDAPTREMLERLVEERTEQLRVSEEKLLQRTESAEKARQAMLYMLEDMNESGAAVERALHANEQQLEQMLQNLKDTGSAIALAVEARDPYTAGHQRRVANLAVVIAQEMGLEEEQIEGVRMGATIHDIGKINLPAEILCKPSMLSDMEYMLVKGHSQVGYDILKNIAFPWPVADIAYQHHERLDGSGYPQGLKGEAICLEARIVAVADVVEAMSSHRPYRPGLGVEAALQEVEQGRGTLFDPVVVDTCLRIFREGRFSLEDEEK